MARPAFLLGRLVCHGELMSLENEPDAVPRSGAAEPSWTDLVRGVQEGDPARVRELYDVFSKGIRFQLYRQLGVQDLDDRVHDVFLIIMQSIQRGDLREPERLMGYVRTVVRRQIAAHIEIAVRNRRNRTDLDFGQAMADHRPSSEHQLIEKEQHEIALRILRNLRERDPDILIRFYLREQSQDQICEEMGLSGNQFRLIKSRAKARFSELAKNRLSLRKGFQP
jgi:RNA polymerase sigma-70 factor, ECF subfamily